MNDEMIVRFYGAYCLSIAGNILPDRLDAEEVLNDVWLAAWNSIPPQRPKNLRTYLGKLTREIAIDRWRKNKAGKRSAQQAPLPLEELEELVGDSAADEEIDAAELGRAISAFLRTLRENERDIFIRRYWFYDPIGSICESYGFSQGKAVMMLRRTREKLAKYLKKEGWMI